MGLMLVLLNLVKGLMNPSIDDPSAGSMTRLLASHAELVSAQAIKLLPKLSIQC
jgi:hypothetical protein